MSDETLIFVVYRMLEAALLVYSASLFIGFYKRKIFAVGRWHSRDLEPASYWQCVIGMALVIVVVAWARFILMPGRIAAL